MNSLKDILQLSPPQFDSHWHQIDTIISGLPTLKDRLSAWEAILSYLNPHPISKGMPYFRLGVFHLLSDADETQAIECLELAYGEDEQYAPRIGRLPHRMGAYRLLSLTKGFFGYLRNQKNWETTQLEETHRQTLTRTLLAVYDKSILDVFDTGGHDYRSFMSLISDKNLARFAMENYFCAEHLLEMFHLQGQHIVKHSDEYPLSRAIIGLLAGTLEAVLVDRLPGAEGKPLGGLVTEAQKKGIIQVGTTLAALSSLMLYFRNHIHPDREISQKDYFIDINVAKGCKCGLDWAVSELLRKNRP